MNLNFWFNKISFFIPSGLLTHFIKIIVMEQNGQMSFKKEGITYEM
jgi:hypothetical protein